MRGAALALAELVTGDTMLDRFIQSLPPAIHDLAVYVPGSFDEVSGRVAMMSASAVFGTGRGRYRGERVRKLHEKAIQQKNSPARFDLAPQSIFSHAGDDLFMSATWYYCVGKGHIARHCEKKSLDRAEPVRSPQGDGKVGGKRSGGLPPRRN